MKPNIKTKAGRREVYWNLYTVLEGHVEWELFMCLILIEITKTRLYEDGYTVIKDYFPELEKQNPKRNPDYDSDWFKRKPTDWSPSVFIIRQECVLRAIELTYL